MHRQGASIREIARRTGLSRTTVRKILSQTVPKSYGPRPPRPSQLDPFVAYLEQSLAARPWVRATTLYAEVAERGFGGHYEAVKRWVRQQRRQQQARRRACVRFETGPGVEAQFDWKGPVQGLLASEPGGKEHGLRLLLVRRALYDLLRVRLRPVDAQGGCRAACSPTADGRLCRGGQQPHDSV